MESLFNGDLMALSRPPCLLYPAIYSMTLLKTIRSIPRYCISRVRRERVLPATIELSLFQGYRTGNAKSAVKYAVRSEELNPIKATRPLSLAILAMAQFELDHSDKAQTALADAAKLITQLNEDYGDQRHHDLLIAKNPVP